VVRKENGKVKQVLGDPDHRVPRGRLYSKCAIACSGIWQDENSRLLYPMKRSGAKGEGKFERIEWQEAIDAIAPKLQAIVDQYGPQAALDTLFRHAVIHSTEVHVSVLE